MKIVIKLGPITFVMIISFTLIIIIITINIVIHLLINAKNTSTIIF